MTEEEIEAFCQEQESHADTMMSIAGHTQQAIINATCAAGMREVINALRDRAGIGE